MALKIKARKVPVGKKNKKKTVLTVEDAINSVIEGRFKQQDLISVIDSAEYNTSDSDIEAIADVSPEYGAAVLYAVMYGGEKLSKSQIETLKDAASSVKSSDVKAALDFARKYREKELADYYMPKYGSAWKKEAAEELQDSAKIYNNAKKVFKV